MMSFSVVWMVLSMSLIDSFFDVMIRERDQHALRCSSYSFSALISVDFRSSKSFLRVSKIYRVDLACCLFIDFPLCSTSDLEKSSDQSSLPFFSSLFFEFFGILLAFCFFIFFFFEVKYSDSSLSYSKPLFDSTSILFLLFAFLPILLMLLLWLNLIYKRRAQRIQKKTGQITSSKNFIAFLSFVVISMTDKKRREGKLRLVEP